MYEPSSATVFTFLDEVNDFQNISDDLQIGWDQLQADSDSDEDVFELFEKFLAKVDNDSIVCFTITTGGGPVSSTVRIGIDMNFSFDDEGEIGEA